MDVLNLISPQLHYGLLVKSQSLLHVAASSLQEHGVALVIQLKACGCWALHVSRDGYGMSRVWFLLFAFGTRCGSWGTGNFKKSSGDTGRGAAHKA